MNPWPLVSLALLQPLPLFIQSRNEQCVDRNISVRQFFFLSLIHFQEEEKNFAAFFQLLLRARTLDAEAAASSLFALTTMVWHCWTFD